MLHWIDSTLYVGLPYSLVALAFAITFKYLRFPDVTVASSFVLGGAMAAVATVHWSANPAIAVLLAAIAGALAGLLTSVVHLLFRIEGLLSSILSAFVIYSVNLLLLHPTLPYENRATVFSWTEHWDRAAAERIPGLWHAGSVGLLVLVVLVGKLLLDFFLATEFGYCLRALEDDVSGLSVLSRLRVQSWKVTTFGLAVGNAFVAVAGALTSMAEGAANVHRGFDVLVTGLISFLLGVKICALIRPRLPNSEPDGENRFWTPAVTTGAVCGPLVYFGSINVAHRLEMPPEYAKLVIAAIVIATAGNLGHLRTTIRKSVFPKGTEPIPPAGVDKRPIAEVIGLSYVYDGDREVRALDNVSIRLEHGQVVLLRGANGAGKSTLAKLICGRLDGPIRGVIRVLGCDATASGEFRRRVCEYVEQDPRRGLVETMTVRENLILGNLGPRPSLIRRASSASRRESIEWILDEIGLPKTILSASPGKVSGGQRQLINQLCVLCRAERPQLVCFDEPFNNVGPAFMLRWLAVLTRLKEVGMTIVVITHSHQDTFKADMIVELDDGHITNLIAS